MKYLVILLILLSPVVAGGQVNTDIQVNGNDACHKVGNCAIPALTTHSNVDIGDGVSFAGVVCTAEACFDPRQLFCDCITLNYVSVVTIDTDPPEECDPTADDCKGATPAVPYIDPPSNGYAYQGTPKPGGGCNCDNDTSPGYWSEQDQTNDWLEHTGHTTNPGQKTCVDFEDAPGIPPGHTLRFKTWFFCHNNPSLQNIHVFCGWEWGMSVNGAGVVTPVGPNQLAGDPNAAEKTAIGAEFPGWTVTDYPNPAPANDCCDDAQVIGCGANIQAALIGATSDDPLKWHGEEIWYKFPPAPFTEKQLVKITVTPDDQLKPDLTVWRACTGGILCVDIASDFGDPVHCYISQYSGDPPVYISVEADAVKTPYANGDNRCNFTLTIECQPCPKFSSGIKTGTTTHDEQTKGTTQRQIQTTMDPYTGGRFVHMAWTCLKSFDLSDPNRQVNYNCYDWGIAGWTLSGDSHGGISIIETGYRGGYPSVDVNSGGNAIIPMHSDVEGASNYSRVNRFSLPGFGVYSADHLLDYGAGECITPSGAVSRNYPSDDIYHVASRQSEPDKDEDLADLVYWRYINDGGYVWQGPVLMDSAMTYAHLVLADGDRVIYAFAKPRSYAYGHNMYDNDLAYYESYTGGADWIANGGPTSAWEIGGGYNCTDYVDDDPHRCFTDLAGGFDSEGRLHLIYNNPVYSEPYNPYFPPAQCDLLHWDEGPPGSNGNAYYSPGPGLGFFGGSDYNFHTITQGQWQCMGNPGKWNCNLSKMSLGFGDGSTSCGGENNLDYLYVTYTQFGSDDIWDQEDVSARGYQNGNLWLSISNDNGFTWGVPRCLTTVNGVVGGTPTRSPNCDATMGDTCSSEHWSSCAELVNDTLHVLYIADYEAGAIVNGEGEWTLNDVMYYPVFGGTDGDLCPVVSPRISVSITADPNCEYYSDADEGVNDESLTISNMGIATLDYSANISYLSGNDWMEYVGYGQSIPLASISTGGAPEDYTVRMDGNGLANGLYQALIEVYHNDITEVTPRVIHIDFFRADSFLCSEGVVVTTPCVALEVSNTESWGRSNPKGGMWRYGETDEDSLFNPIYDGSLAIVNSGLGLVYRDIYPNHTSSNPGFRGLEYPKLSYNAAQNDSVVSVNQTTVDSSLLIIAQYLFPQEASNCEFVRMVYRVTPRAGAINDLIVGAAVDFDCPGTAVGGGSRQNFGGVVADYNLVYQQGADEDPGTHVVATNKYVAGISALTCNPARRMVIDNSIEHVYPTNGFTDEYIYDQMTTTGTDIWAESAGDLHSILAIEQADLGEGQFGLYQMALVSSMAGETDVTLEDMPANVSDLIATTAKAWDKGFGWVGDLSLPQNALTVPSAGMTSINVQAIGTHEDGISGGCCGCIISFEATPTPESGSIYLIDNTDCTASLVFNGVNEGTYLVTLTVTDLCSHRSDFIIFNVEVVQTCFCGGGHPSFGDVTCDGTVNPVDVVYMVNYVYKMQDARCYPDGWNCPIGLGDVNCDMSVNPVDVVYYVNYVYKNLVPFPCNGCD